MAVTHFPRSSLTHSFSLFLQAVAEASKNLSAACIIVISKTGLTSMNISKFRPLIPIVTIVPNAKAGRLLQVTGENAHILLPHMWHIYPFSM